MAEKEEGSNEVYFQIKLSLISLSKFNLAELGVNEALELENTIEWNDLIRSVGSELVFLSQSLSANFILQLITKCHQTISSTLHIF